MYSPFFQNISFKNANHLLKDSGKKPVCIIFQDGNIFTFKYE